ncbi:MAG: MAPEG family protein [Oscillatoriales cyanobacterium RM2_1_1]|nr:MAPEG family protein [Oscillatoriales cyanobacterium SM2_3_0]NJO47421.1 MAPEG family protein [Oscillatoriales cyanobacterium RM2_1_1]
MLGLSTATILVGAIALATVLIYVPFTLVAYNRFALGYDLSAPRSMFDKLPPYAQRAMWAHQNALETFAPFVAAAILAYLIQPENSAWVVGSAVAFVVARLLYSIFYIADLPLLRSLMFGIGSISTGTLLILSLLSVASIR